jgi:hypothetical protein
MKTFMQGIAGLIVGFVLGLIGFGLVGGQVCGVLGFLAGVTNVWSFDEKKGD